MPKSKNFRSSSTWPLWAIGILLAISGVLAPNRAAAADNVILIDKDWPWYIFDDRGQIRYCKDPVPGKATTPCFTNGVKTDCVVLHPDAGYIDCIRHNPRKD